MKKKGEKIQELEIELKHVQTELKQNLMSKNMAEINIQNLVNSKVANIKDELEKLRRKNIALESKLKDGKLSKNDQVTDS